MFLFYIFILYCKERKFHFMKKVFVLMLSFFVLALLLAACGDITNITVPENSSLDRNPANSISWTDQGMSSQAEECTKEGYIHWVLNQAKELTDAELVLGGSGTESYQPTKITPGGIYHFYTPYFDLETLEAFICYEGELGKNAQLVISEYCPGEDTVVILFEEDFTGENIQEIPTGWTAIDIPNWYVDSSNITGGISPEMVFCWYPEINGTSRLVSPVIDASTASDLTLNFKHCVNYFNLTFNLMVQVSTDSGSTWNNVWMISPTENVGPEPVMVDLSGYDGQSFQIAWVFSGYSFNINYWYIDDIVVSY